MSESKQPATLRDVVREARVEREQKTEAVRVEAEKQIVQEAQAKAAALPVVAMKGTALVDEEHGVVYGIGALADAIDLDDEIVPSELLVKCAHDFCASDTRTFKANHAQVEKATLVESWIGVPCLDTAVDGVTVTDAAGLHRLKAGQHVPDDRIVVATAFKASAEDATAWFAGVKPADSAIVQLAKSGGLAGFSWSGPLTSRTKVSA